MAAEHNDDWLDQKILEYLDAPLQPEVERAATEPENEGTGTALDEILLKYL